MGTICSRPRTKHDSPQVNASARPSRISESDYKSADSSLNGNYKPEHDVVLVQRQPSVETSELDVVVQHLHQNNQSVTGSAPELLQQWDHDHGVLVRSIDATIQAAHHHHRLGGEHGLAGPKHVVHVHTEAPRPLSNLGGHATAAHHQQTAPPLHAEPLLLQAQQAYRDGRILQAHSKLQQLGNLRHIDLFQSNPPAAELGIDVLEVDMLKQRVDEGLEGLRNRSGWQVSRDDDLRVAYQHIAGTDIHSFKFAADFETPLENLLALSREFDLTSTWNSYVLDSIVLEEPSIFESTVYSGSWLPFPFPAIDCVVQARGIDLADEDQCLLILCNTPEDMSRLTPSLPAAAAKRKRANIKPGTCIRLQPLKPGTNGQQRVRAEVLVHMQPPVKHVPSVLLNFVLKVMSPFIYNTMRKVLSSHFKSPDQALPTRIRQKPELYALIGPRVQQFSDRLSDG